MPTPASAVNVNVAAVAVSDESFRKQLATSGALAFVAPATMNVSPVPTNASRRRHGMSACTSAPGGADTANAKRCFPGDRDPPEIGRGSGQATAAASHSTHAAHTGTSVPTSDRRLTHAHLAPPPGTLAVRQSIAREFSAASLPVT